MERQETGNWSSGVPKKVAQNYTTALSVLFIAGETYFRYGLAILFSLISVTTFCGGLFVFQVARTKRLMKNTVWILLIIATVSDTLNAITAIPTYIAAYINEGILHIRWVCSFNAISTIFCGLTTIYMIAAISVCRSKVISDPYVSLDGVQYKPLAGYVLFIIVISASLALPPVFGFGEYNHEHGKSWCTFKGTTMAAQQQNKCLIILLCFLGYILPTLIIVFYGIKTLLAFLNTSKQRISVRSISMNEVYLENWRMARLMLIVIVAFLIFWTPIAVYLLMILIGREPHGWFWPMWGHIAHLAMFSQGFINPFVYMCKHKLFNQSINSVFEICTYRNREDEKYAAVKKVRISENPMHE